MLLIHHLVPEPLFDALPMPLCWTVSSMELCCCPPRAVTDMLQLQTLFMFLNFSPCEAGSKHRFGVSIITRSLDS